MRRFHLSKNQAVLFGIVVVVVAAIGFLGVLPGSAPAGFEFSGLSWMQGPPLSRATLKGNAVAVYFASPGCIACEDFTRNMQALQDRYGTKGLVVIGIQRPRYAFENNQNLIRQESKKLGLSHPLALDGTGQTAERFNARRPSVHLFGKNGSLLLGYAGTDANVIEKSVAQALGTPIRTLPKILEPVDVVYAGYRFANRPLGNKEGLVPDRVTTYAAPGGLNPGQLYLEGAWESGPESLKSKGVGRIGMAFAGKRVRIVAKTASPARVLYNGVPLSKDKAGADLSGDQFAGSTERVYEIANLSAGAHSLYLEVPPGFELYEWGVS